MNTFKKITISLAMIVALLAFAPAAKAQIILSTTTFGAAVAPANCSDATFTVASSSGMLSQGAQNNPNTVIYSDKEFDWLNQVVDSTHITVHRCKGIGASVVPRSHASGATIWFANTSGAQPAASQGFKNEQPNAEVSGTCTSTSLIALPIIYLWSGHKYDCIGSVWTETDAPGVPTLATGVTVPAGVLTATGTIMTTDTGTAAMTGIAVPNGWSPGMCLTFSPGGAFTWTTATNIAASGTAVANKTLLFCWNGTKWAASE